MKEKEQSIKEWLDKEMKEVGEAILYGLPYPNTENRQRERFEWEKLIKENEK